MTFFTKDFRILGIIFKLSHNVVLVYLGITQLDIVLRNETILKINFLGKVVKFKHITDWCVIQLGMTQ